MKLIDLDQCVIVPVVDESRGGMRYEIQMSVGELLKRTLEDFEPEIIEAVPVEWLEKKRKEALQEGMRPDEVDVVEMVMWMWQKEQGGEGMRDIMNEPIFAVVVGGILVVSALIYGLDCLRWANEMTRRCRRVQKQINKRRAKR